MHACAVAKLMVHDVDKTIYYAKSLLYECLYCIVLAYTVVSHGPRTEDA